MLTTPIQTRHSPISSSGDHELWIVPQDTVSLIWDSCRNHVEKATRRSGGRYTPNDIRSAVSFGMMQLWIIKTAAFIHAVGITEINKHPGGNELNIVLVGGEHAKYWQHLLSGIEDWGRKQNCKWVIATGRRGLTHMLNDGWSETQRMYEKEL